MDACQSHVHHASIMLCCQLPNITCCVFGVGVPWMQVEQAIMESMQQQTEGSSDIQDGAAMQAAAYLSSR